MKGTSTSTETVIHSGNPATDISAAGVTSVPLGSTVHDKATVTGFSPTGNVTFTWFTNGTCTGAGTPAGTVALDGSGVAHPSTTFGPLAVGSYSFKATYNGDSNFNASPGPCEPLTVGKSDTSTATDIHNDTTHAVITSIGLGGSVHDSATVPRHPQSQASARPGT